MLYILERAPRKLLETEGPFTQLERWLVNCQSHSKPTNQISSPVLQWVGNSTMLSSDAKGHNLCASLPRAELQSSTVFNKLFPKPVGNRQLLLFSRYYSSIRAVTTLVYKLPAKSYLKPGHTFLSPPKDADRSVTQTGWKYFRQELFEMDLQPRRSNIIHSKWGLFKLHE